MIYRSSSNLLLLVACIGLGFLYTSVSHAAAGDDQSSTETYSAKAADRDMQSATRMIEKENYAKAIKSLKKVLRKDDQNADAWNLIGYASRKSGDLDSAAEAYRKALLLDAEHKGALEYQGELFITIGDLASAKANLLKLKQICNAGCAERDDLERAIAAVN